jgi:N-acetyltransferase 10
MFNKAIRKMSLALNSVLEEVEKAALLGDKDRAKVEKAADRMRNVAEQTLDEDAQDAAQVAMRKLNRDSSLPPEIARDDDIMQYAVKGSEEQWNKALDGKDIGNSVQIHSLVKAREKRKLESQDIEREAELQTPKKGGKGTKKISSKKKRTHQKKV